MPAGTIPRGLGEFVSQEQLKGLNESFAQRLAQLISASGGRLRLVSGYRSVERQAQLWANALKKYGSEKAARKWVAPPGKSNHGRGIAADLGPGPGVSKDQAYALIRQLAPKFGLHTPMSWEPWHVEGIDGEAHEDAHTTPPDDFTAADPMAEKMSILGNMLGGGAEDPMKALMEMVQGRATTAQGTATTGGSVSGTGINAVVQAAKAAGFSGDSLVTAIAVAMAESGGVPQKSKYKGEESYGMWQVHIPSHPEYTPGQMMDPMQNAQAAFKISGGGANWKPWSVYKSGAYKQFLDEARRAAGM